MRYQLAPIFCRPWLLNGLSQRLIESHYENNYGEDARLTKFVPIRVRSKRSRWQRQVAEAGS